MEQPRKCTYVLLAYVLVKLRELNDETAIGSFPYTLWRVKRPKVVDLPLPFIFAQLQKQLYPTARQRSIIPTVHILIGIKIIKAIPTPVQNIIKPHSFFISSPKDSFTVSYAARC